MLACATVAAFVGQPVWAALAGAGLVFVSWGLEVLTWRLARDRQDLALGVALSGMVVRLVVVLAGLVIIGLLDRPAFATAALSFVATFTVYLGVRFAVYPAPKEPPGHVGVHR
jgi:hypothetical protein